MVLYPSRVELLDAMRNPLISYKSSDLVGGRIFLTGTRINHYSGGFTLVFPFCDRTGKKIAVRCWIADIGDPKKRSTAILSYLTSLKSPYFVPFKFIDNAILVNGELYPVMTMEWVEAPTLKDFIQTNIGDKNTILKLAANFKKMVSFFHQHKIAHGDLQHGNIKVKNDADLIVLDYDSMFVADLAGMPDVVKGLKCYQHPARENNPIVNAKLDYFSELVIYLSLLSLAEYPELWPTVEGIDDLLLFSREDYLFPNNSPLLRKLRSSGNLEILNLTYKLVALLNHTDISNLKPLEDLIDTIPPSDIRGVTDKF